MRYFIDKENNIFAYEDNTDSKHIKQGLEEITETQYKSFRLFGVLDKDENDIKNKELEDNKYKLLKDVQSLADYWSKEIKNYVSGKKLTPEQIERYNYKYSLAVKCKANNDFTLFDLEAKDAGYSSEELVDLIIKLHDDWISIIEENTIRIEYFRIAFTKRISDINTLEGIQLYEYKLKYAKKVFDINTTNDDVTALLELEEIPEEEISND